jgi:hypothetical protein
MLPPDVTSTNPTCTLRSGPGGLAEAKVISASASPPGFTKHAPIFGAAPPLPLTAALPPPALAALLATGVEGATDGETDVTAAVTECVDGWLTAAPDPHPVTRTSTAAAHGIVNVLTYLRRADIHCGLRCDRRTGIRPGGGTWLLRHPRTVRGSATAWPASQVAGVAPAALAMQR